MCLQAIINGQTPSPIDHPGLPEADPLWSFLQACWSRDPENRPTSNTVLQKVESKPSQLRIGDAKMTFFHPPTPPVLISWNVH